MTRNPLRAAFFFALVLTASIFALPSCKPKVGAKCSPGNRVVCKDKERAFLCDDTHWKEVGCYGPGGCAASTCDLTVGKEGDSCKEGFFSCTADKTTMLKCESSAWHVNSVCDGPAACAFDRATELVKCDSRTSHIGTICTGGGGFCSTDKKTRLRCVSGKVALERECRGPQGCYWETNQVFCDSTLAEPGDHCTSDVRYSCSIDELAVLECRAGHYATLESCKGKTHCTIGTKGVGCN